MKTFILLLSFIIAPITGTSSVIGYGSSDAVFDAKGQQAMFTGFLLGLEKEFKGKISPEIYTSYHMIGGGKLDALKSIKHLMSKNVQLITGFPSSHEALLVAKTIQKSKKDVFALFPAAGHSDLAMFGDRVFTTGEPMQYSIKTSLNFLEKKFKYQKGALIINPRAVFSINQEKNIERFAKEYKVNFTKFYLQKDLTLSQTDLKKIKKMNYLYLTPYPDECYSLLKQFMRNKIGFPILTNSSWTTGDLKLLRSFLINKKNEIYSLSLWLKGSKESLEFDQLCRTKLGVGPNSELSYGYDVGIIIGKILNSAKRPYTSMSLKKSLKDQKCFTGLSTGKICFSSSGGQGIRKLYIVKLDQKKGFIKENEQ